MTSAPVLAAGVSGPPRWSGDGHLYYLRRDKRMMTIPVRTAPSLTVGTPRQLFQLRRPARLLVVSPDGRFLLLVPHVRAAERPISVATAAFRRQSATGYGEAPTPRPPDHRPSVTPRRTFHRAAPRLERRRCGGARPSDPGGVRRAAPSRGGLPPARAVRAHPATDGTGARGLSPPGQSGSRGLAEPRAVLRRRVRDHAPHPGRSRARPEDGQAVGTLGARVAGRGRRPGAPREVDLLDLDAALDELAAFDRRKARVAELRFFGGLSLEEIGHVLDTSLATTMRDWQAARAWLFRRLPLPARDVSKFARRFSLPRNGAPTWFLRSREGRAPHSKETAMPARTATIALSLVALGLTGAAESQSCYGRGATPRPTNRIVGLWSTEGTVSGCATGVPVVRVHNNLLFHAGGTVTENIGPVTTRNQGMGVWFLRSAHPRVTGCSYASTDSPTAPTSAPRRSTVNC